MICGHAKELIAASWTGEIDAAQETKLKQHLAACRDCAAEMSQLTAMWDRLADLPAPEPSLALTARWESTLWPRRPVWQVTIAAAFLVIGLLIGLAAGSWQRRSKSEIAALREEVANTKELVALSLLRQQSASERLRGVDYSTRMPTMEPDVLSALLQAVNHDPSVNVRLAAIDALTRVSGNPRVRQSMVQALTQQDSPMVQAALIDYVVDARDPAAMGTIRQLTTRPDLNPSVRQRADQAVKELGTK
jgi:HEAT repeat protein